MEAAPNLSRCRPNEIQLTASKNRLSKDSKYKQIEAHDSFQSFSLVKLSHQTQYFFPHT